MLSLQLKSGEYFTIGDDIVVQVFHDSSSFRVQVKAPRELS
ncbi:MAG: carbon storage regulator, partial [Clostridiales bacterium]|nr:carbon storage regulator [Clostridiales bacterium]